MPELSYRAQVADTTALTVLVVDDDDDMRELVTMKLELAGDIEVVAQAVDGLKAIEEFERLGAPPTPRVVVLDNRMPGMTGLDVAEQLIQRVPGQHIILFTAFVDDVVLASARAIGVTEVVSKSDINRLPDLVRSLHGSGEHEA